MVIILAQINSVNSSAKSHLLDDSGLFILRKSYVYLIEITGFSKVHLKESRIKDSLADLVLENSNCPRQNPVNPVDHVLVTGSTAKYRIPIAVNTLRKRSSQNLL